MYNDVTHMSHGYRKLESRLHNESILVYDAVERILVCVVCLHPRVVHGLPPEILLSSQ